MHKTIFRVNIRQLWQALFLITGTTWLFAPYLNRVLSAGTAMISEYKMPGQPYFWLFSIGDAFAGLLVVFVGRYLITRLPTYKLESYLLFAIGILMVIDSLAPTTCHVQAGECINYWSPSLVMHGVESVALGVIVFFASVRHSLKTKSLISASFVLLQIINACIFLATPGKSTEYSTAVQYTYELLTALWIAWWVGELLPKVRNTARITTLVRPFMASWAYANGILAITYGIVPLHLRRVTDTLYFAGDTAWLAQHSVLTGLVMLYISRQLWRGEHRARHIFLVVLFLEMIKFALLTPRPILTGLYGLSFVALFCLGDYYRRGSEQLNWHVRLQQVVITIAGLMAAMIIPFILYVQDPKFAKIVHRAVNTIYTDGIIDTKVHAIPMRSALLVHTVHVLIGGLVVLILWALFRPSRRIGHGENDSGNVAESLRHCSSSSEDYFKLWPQDKPYYWNDRHNGFIAYKVAGSVAYALADPIAPNSSERKQLLLDFKEYCLTHGYVCCFLVVAEESIHLFTNQGFKRLQIGASARIDTVQFAEQTVRNKWWRWQMNRGTKQGYAFHISLPPHSQQLLMAWREVSDEWLTRPGHREQGFAMGYFDEEYLQKCTVYYVTDSEQCIVAFTNEVPTFKELNQKTVDLIRFRPDASNAMQFLLARTIQGYAASKACTYFDLGFVPLASTDTQVAKIVRLLGKERFSAGGLEQFKNKFEPEWRKSYIAYSDDISDLALIALNLDEVMKVRL